MFSFLHGNLSAHMAHFGANTWPNVHMSLSKFLDLNFSYTINQTNSLSPHSSNALQEIDIISYSPIPIPLSNNNNSIHQHRLRIQYIDSIPSRQA